MKILSASFALTLILVFIEAPMGQIKRQSPRDLGLTSSLMGRSAQQPFAGHVRTSPVTLHANTIMAGQDFTFPGNNSLYQQTKFVASNVSAGDDFGWSVDISGDYAVVGAPGADSQGADSGAAYVFVRTGTNWTQQAILTHIGIGAGDRFGTSVAISGSTVVVGAPGSDSNGSDSGAAYIFVRSGTSWTYTTPLTPSNYPAGGLFGHDVDIDGGSIVASSIESAVGPGSVFVFTYSAPLWSQQGAPIVLLDNTSNPIGNTGDDFGYSVAISGDKIVVGAPSADIMNINDGAVEFFERSAGVWSLSDIYTVSTAVGGENLGHSVAISGNAAIVGLPGSSGGAGGVAVYRYSGSAWSAEQDFGGINLSEVGNSVSISGDFFVVGAWKYNGGNETGVAFLYNKIGNWSLVGTLVGGDTVLGDRFGVNTALDGYTAVVGAYLERTSGAGGNTNRSGAAYPFFFYTTTASGVQLSGHVKTPQGKGLRNASVIITDSRGERQIVKTSLMGNFLFPNLKAGEPYVLSIRSKRYRYQDRLLTLTEDLSDLELIP